MLRIIKKRGIIVIEKICTKKKRSKKAPLTKENKRKKGMRVTQGFIKDNEKIVTIDREIRRVDDKKYIICCDIKNITTGKYYLRVFFADSMGRIKRRLYLWDKIKKNQGGEQ